MIWSRFFISLPRKAAGVKKISFEERRRGEIGGQARPGPKAFEGPESGPFQRAGILFTNSSFFLAHHVVYCILLYCEDHTYERKVN